MGGIGYVVKLLFIPINNIILSWFWSSYLPTLSKLKKIYEEEWMNIIVCLCGWSDDTCQSDFWHWDSAQDLSRSFGSWSYWIALSPFLLFLLFPILCFRWYNFWQLWEMWSARPLHSQLLDMPQYCLHAFWGRGKGRKNTEAQSFIFKGFFFSFFVLQFRDVWFWFYVGYHSLVRWVRANVAGVWNIRFPFQWVCAEVDLKRAFWFGNCFGGWSFSFRVVFCRVLDCFFPWLWVFSAAPSSSCSNFPHHAVIFLFWAGQGSTIFLLG